MHAQPKFYIPVGWHTRKTHLQYAKAMGLGVEITVFVGGDGLNDKVKRLEMVDELKPALDALRLPPVMHGAFLDLAIHSGDDRIAGLSRGRIELDVMTARSLECEKLIFHTGFNPLIPSPAHRDQVVHGHVEFWTYVLETYPGINICLENLWEPDWEIFTEIFERVNHPRLGLCFDVAHAHVHGHHAPERWIRAMANHLLHMHWNDNLGDRDSHLELGGGNIEWTRVFHSAKELRCAEITLEVSDIPSIERSIRFLNRHGPFAKLASPASPVRDSTISKP